MDQEQLLALIQYLGKYGMSEKDIMGLFGGYFGLDPNAVDTSQLFTQYMPTFQQINQFDPSESLRKSIAKEVMTGTPIWQIQQGIQNAIANGDPGVEAGQTLDDYVSLAKTLENEFQAYNKAFTSAQKDTPAARLGITASPSDAYTVAQVFPGAIQKLTQIYRDRPVNTTYDAGLAARYPASTDGSSAQTDSASTDLEEAKNALKSNAQSYTYGGKDYSLQELRDTLIPMLSKRKQNADKIREQQKKARENLIDYTRAGAQSKSRQLDKANIDLVQETNDWKIAQRDFQKGLIDEQALRKAQIQFAAANETVARLAGEANQSKVSATAAKTPSVSPTKSASGVPIAPKNFGPGSALSARTTTVDPFAMQVTEGVLKGLQDKLNASGKTPYTDQLAGLALLQRLTSGK